MSEVVAGRRTAESNVSTDLEKNAYDEEHFSKHTPGYLRREFAMKVLSIVGMKLLVSFGFMLFVNNVDSLKEFFSENPWPGVVGLIAFFVISFAVQCEASWIYHSVNAFFTLFTMTICMSLFLATLCARIYPVELLILVGVLVLLLTSLLFIAMCSAVDFLSYALFGYVFFISTCLLGIAAIIFNNRAFGVLISVLLAMFMSFCILLDIQLIVDGRSHIWTIDQYAQASICLYSDICMLFFDIVTIAKSK
ncbi:hypothetical protein BEWA_002310 [Theileria equi strain WA]|uniref:Uncharacterized protein n=1 Tax=Theileria equi strain WA TaxID=1537102 RepID=L0B113_THEEQ|nr:hypothetical protein BEWA_002310 [Theileria equi strain WA]AFZ80824.1 hypothetical protein BEWA_002310 [Theileria equi strain WA]|eukprot:XP_004830490.1 hypothetical protein BEWA_002310 [Theileria equi strain WA]